MAATVYIDRIDDLSARERAGVINRLVRRARVRGVSGIDYRNLFSALQQAGIPAHGSSPSGAPNLVLVERNPTIVDDKTIDVELVYEHAANRSQDFDNPVYGFVVGEASACVNQTTTNRDKNGDAVELQHTYAADDPDFGRQTKKQGGSFTLMQPQGRVSYRGLKQSRFPWIMAQALIGTVNSDGWNGGAQGTWMCTNVSWKPYDTTLSRYEIILEFQHNPDGWNPDVVFIDERSGKPPVGLVDGEGVKTVERYVLANFQEVVGSRLLGG